MDRTGSDPAASTSMSTVVEGATSTDAPDLSRSFLTELTHAMQAAAEHQREATDAEVEAMTNAHLERVRTRAMAEADELRRTAQADVDEVHAWQRAEADRIRAEAERRIVVRGQELDGFLVRHGAIIDGEVEHIEGAVQAYRQRLRDYFDQLTTESSPAAIARLADELPEPPDLAKVGVEARVQAVAALAAESGSDGETAAHGNDGSNGSGTNGSGEHLNPAARLLRSLATLGAQVKSEPTVEPVAPSASTEGRAEPTEPSGG